MSGHRSKGVGTCRWVRGGASIVVAAMLSGCGGVTIGPDPEGATQASAAERADAPESGSEDWPDETLPLVTVDLEHRAPAVAPDAGTASQPPSSR